MNRRVFIFIILAAFLAGFAGLAVFDAPLAQAGIKGVFENFYNRFIKPLIPSLPKVGPLPEQESVKSQESTVKSQELYVPTVDYEQAVIKAVEKASPAVVSIIISKDAPIIEQCPYNPFSDLPGEFQRFFQFEFYQPCQKGIRKQEVGGGSGFIISADGLVITNKHVVADPKADYTVFTNDAKKYKAQILAVDPVRDLAIIKINPLTSSGLAAARLGDSDSVKIGQTAIAIGNALGEFRNTVSVGVISGIARSIVASGGGITEKFEGVLQTDAAINQGNSGGPLLNLKGEVIGINVAMVSGAENIGFAIPINQAKRAIESVRRTGKIITPYIGIRYLLITPELAEKEKLAVDYGALARGSQDGPAVTPNSPAAKAGLQAEDIILEINGIKITQENSLALLLQKYNVGDTIILKILRNGKEITVNVKLEERP
jgi:S1-C subfamily serine protease